MPDGPTPRRSALTRHKTPVVGAIVVAMLGSSAVAATSVASGSEPALREIVTDDHQARQPGGGAVASAAPVPVQGVAPDGTTFEGTFELRRFQDRRGTLYAVGQLAGQLRGHEVSHQVRLPVNGASNIATTEGQTQPHGLMQPQQVPTPGACDILTLNLGPLDLDVLGLRIALSEVVLLIEAIPGAGNLLGNLLCAVAGLLNGGLLGELSNLLGAITDLLNALLDV